MRVFSYLKSQNKENDETFFNDTELNQENGHIDEKNDENVDGDEDSDDDDDDDDDDNIHVVIGEIVKKPLSPSRQNSKTGPIASSTTYIK
jgi:hypothetical protein